MFRASLCPSSGARDYDVDYRTGRIVLGLLQAQSTTDVQSCFEPAARTPLQANRTETPTYSKPRTIRPVW